MRHTFSYLQAGIWYRPIIPVNLKLGKKEIRYLALLDSGADFNIFHSDIAKLLDIDLSKSRNSTTFAGIQQGSLGKGYFTGIDLGINSTFKNTPVLFSDDISNNGYGILGQQGFFNSYVIKFDYKKRKIEIVD